LNQKKPNHTQTKKMKDYTFQQPGWSGNEKKEWYDFHKLTLKEKADYWGIPLPDILNQEWGLNLMFGIRPEEVKEEKRKISENKEQ